MPFNIPTYLVWFLIGAVFLVGEMTIPVFVLIFFTVGAWLVAIAVFFFASISIFIQLGIFIIASLLSLLCLRRYGLKNDDAEFIGKRRKLTQDLEAGGYGSIELDGTFWRVESKVSIKSGQIVNL